MMDLYQLDYRDSFQKVIPIEWNKLPDDAISKIPSDQFYKVLSISETGELVIKMVAYFKKVKKFRKDVVEFDMEGGNIRLGI